MYYIAKHFDSKIAKDKEWLVYDNTDDTLVCVKEVDLINSIVRGNIKLEDFFNLETVDNVDSTGIYATNLKLHNPKYRQVININDLGENDLDRLLNKEVISLMIKPIDIPLCKEFWSEFTEMYFKSAYKTIALHKSLKYFYVMPKTFITNLNKVKIIDNNLCVLSSIASIDNNNRVYIDEGDVIPSRGVDRFYHLDTLRVDLTKEEVSLLVNAIFTNDLSKVVEDIIKRRDIKTIL